jgi:hypothetical protein
MLYNTKRLFEITGKTNNTTLCEQFQNLIEKS